MRVTRQWDQFEIFMHHPKGMELKTNNSMNVTNLNIFIKGKIWIA